MREVFAFLLEEAKAARVEGEKTEEELHIETYRNQGR